MCPATTTGLECDSSLTTTLIPARHALGIKSPAIAPMAYYILCQSPPQLGSRSRWISLWSYPSRTASTLFSCVSIGSRRWLTSSPPIRMSLQSKRLNSICGTSFGYMDYLRTSYLTEVNSSPHASHGDSSSFATSREIDLRLTIPNPMGRQSGRIKPWNSTCESTAITNKTTGTTYSPMLNSCTTIRKTHRLNSLRSSRIKDTTLAISCQYPRLPSRLIPLPSVLSNSSASSTECAATTCNMPKPSTKPTMIAMQNPRRNSRLETKFGSTVSTFARTVPRASWTSSVWARLRSKRSSAKVNWPTVCNCRHRCEFTPSSTCRCWSLTRKIG